MSIISKKLSLEIWHDIVAFFEHKGSNSGCWCMNHRMRPEEVVEGEAAKTLLQQGIENDEVKGLLFYQNDQPIGWCAIDPLASLKGHDCIDPDKEHLSTDWVHSLSLLS